ncbi:MAG: YybH family protein [Planctomycetota bacterium]|jgi:ketosteroid isomerase-like protein
MVPDFDISRSAQVLVKQYGKDAPIQARRRADALLSAGDMAARYAKAWSSNSPEAVASCYEEDGRISINNGEPIVGRAAIAEMAQGWAGGGTRTSVGER